MILVIPKMDLYCWRMGFIFYGKHPFFVTRMQVSDAVPKGPLVDLSPIILMECPKHIDAISMIVHFIFRGATG